MIGRVAIVAGGAGDIATSTAWRLIERGVRVYLMDDLPETDRRLVESLSALGGQASYLRCDVTRGADVADTLQEVERQAGRLDCCVNAAGLPRSGARCDDDEEDEWAQVLTTNLTGTWLVMRAAMCLMQHHDRGAIVNVASTAGLCGAAAKAGVIGLTTSAAVERPAGGIRINAVASGPADAARSSDVAEAIVWLLSDQARFVHGHTLVVDGGVRSPVHI